MAAAHGSLQQPLAGRRILLTRASHQQDSLATLLRAAGATVQSLPLLVIAPPTDGAPLAAALVAAHDWVLFTSRNAVERSAVALGERPVPWQRIAAVGPGTANAVSAAGWSCDLVPAQADAEGLAASFAGHTAQRLLLPQADNARPVLAELLRAQGHQVSAVIAYRALAAEPLPSLPRPLADLVVHSSAASVDRFLAAVAADPGFTDHGHAFLANARHLALGPHTATRLHHHGLACTCAAEPTDAAVLAAAV